MQLETNLTTEEMIQQIGNDAVSNVYSKNGVLYFQLPDGTITMENPFEKGEFKEQYEELTNK